MPSSVTLQIEPTRDPSSLWEAVAQAVVGWIDERGLARRDAIVLVPFAELLPHARQAFARVGGWLPRVETLRTLNASLGPQPEMVAGAPCGDLSIDHLVAERWLRQLPSLDRWRQQDRRGYEHAVTDLVEAAQMLLQAAAELAPGERDAWWQGVDAALRFMDGPGALEAAMARLAVQWARQAQPAPTDRLHGLRPSAWVVVQAGGPSVAVTSLLRTAESVDVPSLLIRTDSESDWPEHGAQANSPQLLVVDTAEQEAWAAAGAIIDCVARGETPVALIAQDRLLVRRTRALLERRALRLFDESGWALSTTRAASRLVAVLRATLPSSGPDGWMDGLKVLALEHQRELLDALEQHWRRRGSSAAIRPDSPERLTEALAWWHQVEVQWRRFAMPGARPLSNWLSELGPLVADALGTDYWQRDPAAMAVRTALHLDLARVRDDIDGLDLTLQEFVDWVDRALEQANFVDRTDADHAQVVITPLARAILRPFGAVVFPATDEQHLGSPPKLPDLLSESLLRQIGMEDRSQRQQRSALVFAQLLRHPRLILLRRRAEGSEHLGASIWISRLQQARRDRHLPTWPERDAKVIWRELVMTPVLRPAPVVGAAVPVRVSASAVEALRACPYRFYARAVLGLGEVDELEADPGKRDYGDLLHLALQRFHDERTAQLTRPSSEDSVQRLARLVHEVADQSGLDHPAMFPFEAGIADFARRYLDWLTLHEAQGWRHQTSELALACKPPALGGLQLQGRIDRVDRQAIENAVQLIDYKTGRAEGLAAKVKDPLEDTQLAFYAAQWLQAEPGTRSLSAMYLALDDRQGIVEVMHKDVEHSAVALLAGLATDWDRLQSGAPLLALGEGSVCETCEARGLCRRDHWALEQLPSGLPESGAVR